MRILLSTLAVGVIVGASVIGGTALTASAHVPGASATCSAVTFTADTYQTKPETPAATHEVPATDRTVVVTPATPAVTHVEYQYQSQTPDADQPRTAWELDGWDGETLQDTGWAKTGQSRVVVDTPAIQEVTESVVDLPAHSEVVTPASAADETPNVVTVTIDGTVVHTENFGVSVSGTVAFSDQYTSHDWSVAFTAWDDPTGSLGYTKTYSGTTSGCAPTPVQASPKGEISTGCGVADVHLSNEAKDEGTVNDSYTAAIHTDSEPDRTVVVASGDVATEHYTFVEDSGTHTITVTAAGTEIAHGTVQTDCQPNVKPANPHTNLVVDCGVGTVYSSNDFTPGFHNVGTAYVEDIYVDGVNTDTIDVAASGDGAAISKSYSFAEDSGNHTIVVKVGDQIVAQGTVTSDCQPPVVPPTNPPTTTTTTVPPTTTAPPVESAGLAYTGTNDPSPAFMVAGLLMLLGLIGVGSSTVSRLRTDRGARG
ncbi:MAG TPA: hypothetical protein VGC18_07165 [Lacisediminihabitans sp.]|uniref:hypothetical protein n=1 Tax=Lacisediminihabitans sp. TaxID=2787631 RepID=UPI002ED804E5